MAEMLTGLAEMILRDVAASGPEPWYPGAYVQATGVPREAVDACLDTLRLGGLLRLTDWVQGRGQGYALTPLGEDVLASPRLLNRLREGRELPRRPQEPAAEPSLREGTTWARGEAVRAALLDPSRPVITQVLLWANILVFVAGLVMAGRAGVMADYINFGSTEQVGMIRKNTGSLHAVDLIVFHEWWRLLSYSFVHGGIIHLALNMWVLLSVGALVEKMWGSLRYLGTYLISALGGGCCVMLFHIPILLNNPRPLPYIVGASGALCGLLTSMAVWVWMNRPYLPPRLASDWMRNIITNIVLIAIISILPGISWEGHLGGGVAGALVAVPMVYNRFGTGLQRALGLLGVLAVPALSVGLVYRSLLPTQPEMRRDDPKVRTANAKYAPTLRKANEIATDADEQHGRRFLVLGEDPAKSHDAVKQALAAFEQAQQGLQRQADTLGRGAHENGGAIRKGLLEAQSYTRDWKEFYKQFAAALRSGADWPGQRDELRMRKRILDNRWRNLRTLPLFDPELKQ
jgi:membrane associated rhomboid family serine protease